MPRAVTMDQFYAKAGEILLVSKGVSGIAPRRTFSVRWDHENGWNSYNGKGWEHWLYTPEEQRSIDRERMEIRCQSEPI